MLMKFAWDVVNDDGKWPNFRVRLSKKSDVWVKLETIYQMVYKYICDVTLNDISEQFKLSVVLTRRALGHYCIVSVEAGVLLQSGKVLDFETYKLFTIAVGEFEEKFADEAFSMSRKHYVACRWVHGAPTSVKYTAKQWLHAYYFEAGIPPITNYRVNNHVLEPGNKREYTYKCYSTLSDDRKDEIITIGRFALAIIGAIEEHAYAISNADSAWLNLTVYSVNSAVMFTIPFKKSVPVDLIYIRSTLGRFQDQTVDSSMFTIGTWTRQKYDCTST